MSCYLFQVSQIQVHSWDLRIEEVDRQRVKVWENVGQFGKRPKAPCNDPSWNFKVIIMEFVILR